MNYAIIITETDTPLGIGVLTNCGRIERQDYPTHWFVKNLNRSQHYSYLSAIEISLKEVILDSQFEKFAKTYKCSPELQEQLQEAYNEEITVVEDKCFNLCPSPITTGTDLGEEGKDWFWEARPVDTTKHIEHLSKPEDWDEALQNWTAYYDKPNPDGRLDYTAWLKENYNIIKK